MKKNLPIFIVIIIVIALAIGLVFIQKKDKTKDNDENNATVVEIKSKFEQFENSLKEKGIEFEKNSKSAILVGAKEGYSYIFDDGNSIELYLFDASTEAYKKVKSSGNMLVEDFGILMPVELNKDLAIYYNGEISNKLEIQSIFNSIK